MNALVRFIFVVSLVFGLAFLTSPLAAFAQAAAEGRKLTVSSNALAYADPDAAVITFTVTGKGSTSKDAREHINKRTKAIKDRIADLKHAGISIDVVPTPLQLLVAAVPGPDGSQPTEGFQSQSRFSVNIREKDKGKLRDLVVRVGDIAVENGGVGQLDERESRFRMPARFGGLGLAMPEPPEKVPGPSVEWLCENDRQARAKAVKSAVEEARATAFVVAESAALTVKEVHVQQNMSNASLRRSLIGEAAPSVGRVLIEVTVTVTFAY